MPALLFYADLVIYSTAITFVGIGIYALLKVKNQPVVYLLRILNQLVIEVQPAIPTVYRGRLDKLKLEAFMHFEKQQKADDLRKILSFV